MKEGRLKQKRSKIGETHELFRMDWEKNWGEPGWVTVLLHEMENWTRKGIHNFCVRLQYVDAYDYIHDDIIG